MDPELLVGLVAGGVGLLGAAAGMAVPIAMWRGSFSRWTATRPRLDVAPVSREELLRRLLSLEDPHQPYHYQRDDRYDLRAEWRVADSAWWGVLNRNGLTVSYLAKIYLNDRYREVRIVEEWGRIQWTAGMAGPTPMVSYQRSLFKGILLFERAWERAYAFQNVAPPDWGQVVNYDFDVWRIKAPILRTVVEAGWTFCPVVMERHLRADRPLAG